MWLLDMSPDVLYLLGVLFFVSKTLNEQEKRMSSRSLSLSLIQVCHMQFISPSHEIFKKYHVLLGYIIQDLLTF